MAANVKIPMLGNGLVRFILCATLVAVFILWGQKRYLASVDELSSLEQRIRFSQESEVVPYAGALQSLKEANVELERLSRRIDDELYPEGRKPTTEFSGDSTAAYFELVGFVEDMNQMFSLAGIRVPEQVRFGFSQFAQQGPGTEILSAVMRQKQAAEALLRPLSLAKPKALVFLKREYLAPGNDSPTLLQRAAGSREIDRIHLEDTFTESVKHEVLESFSFELEFEGYTDSLREYLKYLWSARFPIVVTDLEVRPLDRFEVEEPGELVNGVVNPFDLLKEADEVDHKEGPVPIIRNNLSAFKLSLEVYSGKELENQS